MKAVWTIVFALIGLIAGYALTAAIALASFTSPAGDSGGTAMGIFFGLAPVGAIVGAVAGIVLGLKR